MKKKNGYIGKTRPDLRRATMLHKDIKTKGGNLGGWFEKKLRWRDLHRRVKLLSGYWQCEWECSKMMSKQQIRVLDSDQNFLSLK